LKKRTLIVEDDAATAMLLAIMLEDLGFEVCGTETTEEGAIQAASDCAPDLMIVGTGIAAVNAILKRGHVAHVFVSADLTELKVQRPDAVMLEKPYVYTQLANAIIRATSIVV
jgi:CheY-like chemotaxis protein